MDARTAALAWHAAGACVIPPRLDGSKAPAYPWQQYTRTRPTLAELESWYIDPKCTGVGLVCGLVSGQLEMLELEGRGAESLAALSHAADVAGISDLWRRLTNGYWERSPSGGFHWLYRIGDGPVPGNTKLARDASRLVLAETRGEGGYVIVAPSHGMVHETGRPWQIIAGSSATVPTFTMAERDELHRLFRLLDESPPAVSPTRLPVLDSPRDGLSPGDDFEQRESWTSDMLLGGAGWQQISGHDDGYGTWRRPGKTRGISATTGKSSDRDRLYVFTSSTEFDTETPYTKFGCYALLHHGGDHGAAARELARLGYGARHVQDVTLTPFVPITGEAHERAQGFAASLVRRSELRSLPPVEPLIAGVLSQRSAVVLVGSTGVGKTFVALSWACSVASGLVWLGQATERRRVLYVVGEGASGLHARVNAWEQAWQRPIEDDELIFSVRPESLNAVKTWQELREQAHELGAGLIVLDTFSSLAPDADETKDAALMTRRLSDLASDLQATALLIHHPGWSDNSRTRGGYQLEANVDEVLVLSGESESDLIELRRKKVKDGEAGASRWLRRRRLFGSIVIESASDTDAVSPVAARVLSLLVDAGRTPLSGPQIAAELKITHRSTLWRALRELTSSGRAIESGTDRVRVWRAAPSREDSAGQGTFRSDGGD